VEALVEVVLDILATVVLALQVKAMLAVLGLQLAQRAVVAVVVQELSG
jgi:hypothetical protein